MIKKIILILLLLFFISLAFAEKAAVLPGLLNPEIIDIDGNQMFITEGTTIYIYSLNDFKLQKKFGSAGEGPREFKMYASVFVQPDQLFIRSPGKVSFFTRQGDFIKETNVSPGTGVAFQPVGDQYVGRKSFMEENIRCQSFNIYDSKFKMIKEIYRKEHDFQRGKGYRLPTKAFDCNVYHDKIFIAGKAGLEIDVFDKNGNRLYTIHHDIENVKFTETHKKRILDTFKANPQSKQFYEIIKNQLKYPDYFPVVREFIVTDGKIYVLTYNRQENKIEFLILDVKGKLLKRQFLLLHFKQPFLPYPYTIHNGKLYQLVENADEEKWELHASKIL
jgi:hypothetical protein